MADRLRLAAGVMGNGASMLLYCAPILTFSRVVRKKSTGEYSCIPYIIAMLNCLLFTWYGLPLVSCGWENFPVVTINGLGILLELSFVLVYFWFSPPKEKKNVGAMTILAFLVFFSTGIISSLGFHDHRHRKIFVGSVGVVVAVAMYGSPLVVMKRVVKTKSVQFMPFYLSLFSFLASSLWLAYGLLSHDLFLASPNLVGSPLGFLQLILYCKYRKGGGGGGSGGGGGGGFVQEPNEWDVQNNDDDDEKNKPDNQQLRLRLQLVVAAASDTNGNKA